MKGFRTRISRKDSSTPPPGSPAKKPSPLTPVRSASASSEASPISIRLARGSADSAVSGSPSASASSNRTPRRTASRSSTASVSSLSAPAPAQASRRAGASSAPDAYVRGCSMDMRSSAPSSTTRDPAPAPAPASRQLKEPTDPVLPQARPKDKDAAPSEQASTTSASVPKADQASIASSTKADPPPTPPSSPPPPPVMPAPIPRSMSPPLTIDTNGVPRRGSEEHAKAKDDESFVHLTESEHATADSADAPPLQLQMPEPQTTTAHASEGPTNPFLDQPETPNSIDVQHLAMPQPRAANGKSVSFSQTVQEISPLTDYAPSPSSDHATAASSAPAGATWSWTEHVLPDTTYYYSLPASRSPTRCTVVTDMDLRNAQRLRVVEAYLRTIPPIAYPSPAMPQAEPHTPTSPFTFSFPANAAASANPFAKQKKEEYESIEVYLRNVAPRSRQSSGEFVPLTTYVRHGTRAVSMQPPFETREVLTDADRLDQEAQYWAFLEAHPAHAVLPPGARDDALEALTWSYTERVLESRNAARVGNAFSERECHELLALLRGLEGTKAASAMHTRLVAKVHLRLAQWRQQFVSLGESGGYPPKHVQTFDVAEPRVRVPFRRSCARLVFGVLCLGIPYLFYSRSTARSNTDEQDADERATASGGLTPRAASSLVFSAAVCLIGAVMLSVSVTFLALPGLEKLARALALLSAMCSLASLGASVLVMPRRAGSPITLTRARALPAVLLAYAVASFVGATVAYAAKGVVQRDPRAALEGFGAQTLWMVVAVWAVLAVVLAGAAWILRGGPRQAASRGGGYRALPS